MNKIKLLIGIIVFSIMAMAPGCSPQSEGIAVSGGRDFDIICLRSVEYYYHSSQHLTYLAPAIKPDGAPYTCEMKDTSELEINWELLETPNNATIGGE